MRQIDAPIVGILAQENNLFKKLYPEVHSFIPASYVKFVEAGGGRAIPIWIGQDPEYYERVVKYTNGTLFPGGLSHFIEPNGYGAAARLIYKYAMESFEENMYYPILGICLGLEVLAFASADGKDVRRTATNARSICLPITLKEDFLQGKLYTYAPNHLLKIASENNITYNHHQFSIFEEDLKENNIRDQWLITATNRDVYGSEFISSMEHKKYPFYGVMYHPEKAMFEFGDKEINHDREAREFAQYVSNFFLDECAKNINGFPTAKCKRQALIYNYHPSYTGLLTKYQQLYLFKKKHYKKNLLIE